MISWFPTTCNMFWYKDFLRCFFRLNFVKFLRLFVGCFVAKRFATRFATNSLVRISSGFRQNLNWSSEMFDKIWSIFFWQNVVAKRFARRQNFAPSRVLTIFFLVAQRFATTFCHNILPQKQLPKFSPKLRWNFVKFELKQRNLWRNFSKIFAIIFCGKRCGKMGCHKVPRNLQRNL